VLLVIVVIAGAIALAAAIFLRSRKAWQPRNTGKDDPAGDGSHLPCASAPADSELPVNVERTGTAAAKPAMPPLGPVVAAPVTAPDPAGTAPGAALEVEFTLENVAANGTAAAPSSPRAPTPGPPTPTVAATPAPGAGTGAKTGPTPTAPPATPQVLQPPEIFAKLFDLALGKGRSASSVTAGHDDVAAATSSALQDTATQERYAPRRPNMLPRVLSAANDDGFSSRELAALIARDPSLVGNLLKIANSSYYRVTSEPVESVDRAVVLLGTNGIRSLVTAALMQPIFRIGGADFPRFPEIAWEHTFRSASACVPYNFLIEKSDPFVAELLSLVMGLAEIVVFRVAMDQYAKNPRLRPDAGIVASLIDDHSANVARRIGTTWELSESTLAGLDGQTVTTTAYPTALGRSLYFGRVVGALAVLRINRALDDETAKASIPVIAMPQEQVDRMWTRLTSKSD
jgi:hypothetical protein